MAPWRSDRAALASAFAAKRGQIAVAEAAQAPMTRSSNDSEIGRSLMIVSEPVTTRAPQDDANAYLEATRAANAHMSHTGRLTCANRCVAACFFVIGCLNFGACFAPNTSGDETPDIAR